MERRPAAFRRPGHDTQGQSRQGRGAGTPVVVADPGSPSALAITSAAKHLTTLLPPIADDGCSARLTLLAEQIAQMA